MKKGDPKVADLRDPELAAENPLMRHGHGS
jgi:hypothetical protein